MATKKELEETIKVLKKKVKDLEREKKDLTAKQEDANLELEGLPLKAVSILKSDGTTKHKVVLLKYDLVSRRAMVESEIDFNISGLHMATAKINKELANMLLKQKNKKE